MTLISCAECHRKISDKAGKCPHCGFPLPGPTDTPAALGETDENRNSDPAGKWKSIGDRLTRLVLSALAWFFGVILVMAGFGMWLPPNPSPKAGTILLLSGTVLIPPTTRYLNRRFGIPITPKIKTTAIVVLLLAFFIVSGVERNQSAERLTAERERASRDSLRAVYDTGTAGIIEQITTAIDSHQFDTAISIASRFLFVGDSTLDSLHAAAQALRQAELDQEREALLVRRVRQVPASNLEMNRSLYQELMGLNPDNSSYRARFTHYDRLIRERNAEAAEERRRVAAVAAERRRRFGAQPQASAWDGTYREVKDYLRRVANDPESIEIDVCTGVYYIDEGWLVGCDYRGRNAFGGMIRQSNWFVIRNGAVVAMKDPDAYRP